MRYGGHQTFPIREGWLTKAINLLETDPAAFTRKDLSEVLGVGTNMAKAIEHWIVVTGLATRLPAKEAHQQKRKYVLTPFGRIVAKHDPFLTAEDTWWLLHINIVNDESNAVTWSWFFNDFAEKRFEKSNLVGRLMRHERSTATRPASEKTIERDISCFLASYAKPVPREKKDPEEDLGSPLQDLGIMSSFRATGAYELHRRAHDITPEVLLYSIVKSGLLGSGDEGDLDFTFTHLTHQRSGPLQTLVLSAEGLFESLLAAERETDEYQLSVRGFAGDRQITMKNVSAERLVENLYRKVA
jgi:hypothetical protein